MVSSNNHRALLKRTRITPTTIAQTGVNPVTGEYLSAEQRKSIFKRTTVSSKNVFSKPGALVKVGKPGALTKQDDGSGKGITVNILFTRVVAVEKQIAFLAKALNKEAELEKKARRDYEQEELKEAESQRRSAKEKNLEKGIFKALISPVQAVAGKAQSVLGNLMGFFGILLGGWLTNQGWKAIKANAEGDTKKLEGIRDEVVKTLGIIAGIFAILNGGIFGILGIIGAITFRILTKPFRALIDAFRGGGKPNQGGGGKSNQGGGAKPSGGGGPSGSTNQFGPGTQRGGRIPGAQGPASGKSTFGLEQARKVQTQQNMMRNSGPKGPFDMIKRFIRGKLEQHRHAGKGKHIVRILDGAVKTFNWFSNLPGFKQIFGVIRNVINFITKPKESLGKIFKKMGAGGKGGGLKLLRILQPLLFALSIRKRAEAGMSPAQAIIGGLFPLAGSIAGGALGGTIGAAGGPLAFFGALGGSFLGGLLGEQLMGVLDNFWTPNKKSWDNFGPFKAINEAVYNLQSGDNAFAKGLQAMFPYEGTEKYKQNKQSTQVSGTTPSAPEPTSSPSVSSSPSSMPSAPLPVSGSGNTTVIYKKIGGAGRGAGDQSLKSGSSTDVPLIASANPSNFYTMYSQIVYNVVS